jgi:hypothetical protein
MNTSASSPRLSCRLVRLRAALGGDPARSAHVAGCADCQRHFAAVSAFDAALRRDTARNRAEIPAGLDRGILRAVAESRLAPPAAEKSSGAFAWLAGGALAAAAAVALVFALRSPATAPGGVAAVEPPPAAGSAGARVAATEQALPSVPVLDLPTAETLVSRNPLQSEIDQVYSDAQYALRFLAMNFLPTLPERDAARPRRGEG